MIIFKIKNKKNGKVYVGNAINDNPNNLGSGKYIKRAIKDFGVSSFERTILEEIDSEESLGLFMDRTEFWIRHFKADNPKYGYNESVAEMIPQKKKLSKKLQVLLFPEDEENLNSIIIQKSMERGVKPIPISRYIRSIIVEHIVQEISPEKQLIKIK